MSVVIQYSSGKMDNGQGALSNSGKPANVNVARPICPRRQLYALRVTSLRGGPWLLRVNARVWECFEYHGALVLGVARNYSRFVCVDVVWETMD